ncbi:MAG: aminomethyl-transferring glycine dehydrogenase subunit GcvPA [Candidatus Zixiibacteriota bacterium]|nr:MAG: aminomethyl-transferring glycine dehydrogenase subunit GcvPA [candidate division Zixibacteria bacterium]
MKHFLPQTDDDLREMLEKIGVKDFRELIPCIPPELYLERALNLPAPLSELEALEYLKGLAASNRSAGNAACFMGGGAYDHFVPAAVGAILARSEFYTAYTPYQAEVSQGTLQAIYEYQTLICRLTGMDAANASHYDGATSLAEAMLVSQAQVKRDKILVSRGLHPHYLQVLHTYAHSVGLEVDLAPLTGGLTDADYLRRNASSAAAVVVQSPNFLGYIEDVAETAGLAHNAGALLVVSADPISLALLEPPGKLGADIVTGEGQGLGNSVNFGGPYLGIFAVKKELVRRLPGRLIGATTDVHGKRGYVMTLQTREQHIRRDKATSNICTNQALVALAACIALELLGEQGLKDMAELCLQKSHYLADQIAALPGFSLPWKQPFFKEFPVKYEGDVKALLAGLAETGYLAGPDLGQYDPAWQGMFLLAATEKRTRKDLDGLVAAMKAAR